ncbi:MAG: VTT domain-containing protein [Oscillospiraceae bacterium]|jgi:uncharacterized membrane protein YdjX (TVP38/TMEM64 family)|nr:VTT domain-containing protein [Oscillospiraceae bacterium]
MMDEENGNARGAGESPDSHGTAAQSPESNEQAIKSARRKTIERVGVIIILAAIIAISFLFGRRLTAWARDPSLFKEWAQANGWRARFSFIGLFVAQVVFAFIPGEPLEIAAGAAFGAIGGMLLSLAGAIIGSSIVFALTRALGWRFVELFFSRKRVESLAIFNSPRRLHSLLFLLYLIPGTPKDLLNYAAPFTRISMIRFLIISTVARIPSVITSTWGGSAISANRLNSAIIIFAATALISLAGLAIYRKIHKR